MPPIVSPSTHRGAITIVCVLPALSLDLLFDSRAVIRDLSPPVRAETTLKEQRDNTKLL